MLRDHFHPPVSKTNSWDELHGMWPSMIVRDLFGILPPGYRAAPNVHLGPMFEIDVVAFEKETQGRGDAFGSGGGSVATEVAPYPTLTFEADLAEFDEYEVRIYDDERGRQLVAAIELVSPSNKDRPESRRAFLAKVEALLHKDVCVSIVDLCSIPQFNLYGELLDLLDHEDPQLAESPAPFYALTLRSRKRPKKRSLLDVWFYAMSLGQPLPTLPIWLSPDLRVLLPLETSYEETCRLLHIA